MMSTAIETAVRAKPESMSRTRSGASSMAPMASTTAPSSEQAAAISPPKNIVCVGSMMSPGDGTNMVP